MLADRPTDRPTDRQTDRHTTDTQTRQTHRHIQGTQTDTQYTQNIHRHTRHTQAQSHSHTQAKTDPPPKRQTRKAHAIKRKPHLQKRVRHAGHVVLRRKPRAEKVSHEPDQGRHHLHQRRRVGRVDLENRDQQLQQQEQQRQQQQHQQHKAARKQDETSQVSPKPSQVSPRNITSQPPKTAPVGTELHQLAQHTKKNTKVSQYATKC